MSWQPKLVDMAQSPEEAKEDMPCPVMPDISTPRYPYGLALCLTDKELDKLGLDASCDVGDTIRFNAEAKVTSVSCNETDSGKHCRVELQITSLGIDGMTEEAEEPGEDGGLGEGDYDQPQSKSKRLYASG